MYASLVNTQATGDVTGKVKSNERWFMFFILRSGSRY